MTMEYGIWPVQLEVRQDGDRPVITGRFPLNTTATVRDSGRVRKERFATGSMSWQVREFMKVQAELGQVIADEIEAIAKERRIAQLQDALEKRNTHLLVGHDFNRAVADMKSGTLAVRHGDDFVDLEATLPLLEEQPSWVRDAVLAVKGGQLRGVSPGFNVPRAQGRERLIPEDPADGDSMIREIQDSVVYEYSLVSRPAYPLTEVNARSFREYIPIKKRWWF